MNAIRNYKYYKLSDIIKLILFDSICILFALVLALILFYSYKNINILNIFIASLIYISFTLFCLNIFGLYNQYLNTDVQEHYLRAFAAICLTFVIINNISYIFPITDLGLNTWLFINILSYIFISFARTLFFVFNKNNNLKSKTLILGTGNRALELKNCLAKTIESGINIETEICGYVRKPGDRDRLSYKDIVNLSIHANNNINSNSNSNHHELLDYCLDNNINTIVIAVDDRRNNFPVMQLLNCKRHGINIIELMEFFESQLCKQNLNILSPSWIIFSNKLPEQIKYDSHKKVLDFSLGFISLLICMPILIIFSILLKINLGFKSEIINKTKSTSRYCQYFYLYNFNLYHKNNKLVFIGKLINFFKLKSLPMLFNLIKGDISFVGPSIVSSESYKDLSKSIWYYSQRFNVKPGLISWGYDLLDNNSESLDIQKLEYDLFYIKNRSLLLDLNLIIKNLFNKINNIISGRKNKIKIKNDRVCAKAA